MQQLGPSADLGRRVVGCRVQVYWREYEDWLDASVLVRSHRRELPRRTKLRLVVELTRGAMPAHCRAPPKPRAQAYSNSRHHVLYEDGQEDVGIIDGRKLWTLDGDKWTSMRLRWKDEDVSQLIDRPGADDAVDGEAPREGGDGKNQAAPEAKNDAQAQPTAEPASGFMIGCDQCGTARESALFRSTRGLPRAPPASSPLTHLSPPSVVPLRSVAADKWYYGWNVDITEHEAKDIKKYLCPKCVIEGARKRGGKGTNKRFRTGNAKMSQP
jgi:hypothetical protein